MGNRDKVKMKINIAGEPIQLTVPFSDQDYTRETEKNLNNLFDTWRRRFADKSDTELLAMVAFQYASYYDALKRAYLDAEAVVDKMEGRLDALLAQEATLS